MAGIDVKLCKAINLLLANFKLIEERKKAKAAKAAEKTEKSTAKAVGTESIGETEVAKKTKVM